MSDTGRALVIAAVEAVVPSSDLADGFCCVAKGDGAAEALNRHIERSRTFALLTASLPSDAGIASGTAERLWSEDWELRVNYHSPAGDDEERMRRILAADARAIVAALLPSDAWAAGLDNLHVGYEAGPPEEVPGDDGQRVGLQIVVSMTAEYYA